MSDNNDDLDSDSDLNTDEEDALDDVGIEMEDPCSADDISDEEASDLYDTDNVVVCQYEKISRSRNKWKFVLKVVSPLFICILLNLSISGWSNESERKRLCVPES